MEKILVFVCGLTFFSMYLPILSKYNFISVDHSIRLLDSGQRILDEKRDLLVVDASYAPDYPSCIPLHHVHNLMVLHVVDKLFFKNNLLDLFIQLYISTISLNLPALLD